LKAYLEHYWSLERREYVRVVSEGEDDRDGPTSTAHEEKGVEVLTAITEAENVSSMNMLRKMRF
jgi:hypothetical protein